MRSRGALEAIGDTPAVRLAKTAPGSEVWLKLEGANPTGSMKDRMALAMIDAARREGLLPPGGRVVEFTGGSTGSSLAFVCAALGHPLSLVTADCFSEEKIRTMRALGADVEVLDTPERKAYPGLVDRMAKRVEEIRAETGAYWTRQVRNGHQLEGYEPLAREILRQCPGVTDFVMSVGTAGCSMGTSRVLRDEKPGVRVTLVEPAEAPYLTKGEGGAHGVEGIALLQRPPLLDDRLYDAVLDVPEAEGREVARRLAREEGLLVGTSTGLNVAAALRVARERPGGVVVTIAVDTGLKYLAGDLFAV